MPNVPDGRVEVEHLALLRAELTVAFAALESTYLTLDADAVIDRFRDDAPS